MSVKPDTMKRIMERRLKKAKLKEIIFYDIDRTMVVLLFRITVLVLLLRAAVQVK